jgi:hypothetical protein
MGASGPIQDATVTFRIDAIQLLEYGALGQHGYSAITGDLGRRALPCTCRFALAVDFTAPNNHSVMLSAEVVRGGLQSVFFQQFTVRATRHGSDRTELLLTPITLSDAGPYVFVVWLGQSPIFILTASVAQSSAAP